MIDKKLSTADEFALTSVAIAADLESMKSNAAISVASMAVELRAQIQMARQKGASFKEIAEIFRKHGLPAEADTIRIALGRNIVTKAARGRKRHPAKPAVNSPTPVAPADASVEAPRRNVNISNEAQPNGASIAPRLK